MIKTLKEDECKFLRRILPHYVEHMTKNPNSLVNRYYGLHRVKMPHLRRKIHFVVMNNIFMTPKPIHTMYDLKGATYSGRYVKMSKIIKKSHKGDDVVRKDLNFHGFTDDAKPGSTKIDGQPTAENRQWLKIGDPKRKILFANQVAADAVFLANCKIMDYSLLVGVHGRDPVLVPGYIPPQLSEDDDGSGGSEEESEDDDDDADAAAAAYNYHSEEEEEEEGEEGEEEGESGESKDTKDNSEEDSKRQLRTQTSGFGEV